MELWHELDSSAHVPDDRGDWSVHRVRQQRGPTRQESNPCLDLKKAAAMTAKEIGEHRRAGVQLLPTRQGGVKTALASGPADAEF